MFCSRANILSSLDKISDVIWDVWMIFFNTKFYADLAFIRIFSLNFTKIEILIEMLFECLNKVCSDDDIIPLSFLEIYWSLGFMFWNYVTFNQHEICWQGKVEMIFTQSCMNRFVNTHVFETAFLSLLICHRIYS